MEIECLSDYKSTLCPQFESTQSCMDGSNCTLAHGLRELRSEENPLYKAQICTAFEQGGRCRFGSACMFAHGEEELRDFDFGSQLSSKRSETSGSKPEQSMGVCFYFQKYGNCSKGDECIYSHSVESAVGVSKLQQIKSVSQLQAAKQKKQTNTNIEEKLKTRLCFPFLKAKTCQNGDNCHFAHGEHELRAVSAEVSSKTEELYKTNLCKNYEKNGSCILADTCTFAHGRYELRPVGFKGNFEEKLKANPNWKCSMCHSFQLSGRCQRGTECDYAHGEAELRSSKQKPSAKLDSRTFKTSLCKEFMTTNFCRYGNKCTFAHGESELKSSSDSPITALKMEPETRKRQFSLENFASMRTMVSNPVSQGGGESMNDLKMFAEFLEFKKFKEQSQAMGMAGMTSTLMGSQQVLQSPSHHQSMSSGMYSAAAAALPVAATSSSVMTKSLSRDAPGVDPRNLMRLTEKATYQPRYDNYTY